MTWITKGELLNEIVNSKKEKIKKILKNKEKSIDISTTWGVRSLRAKMRERVKTNLNWIKDEGEKVHKEF